MAAAKETMPRTTRSSGSCEEITLQYLEISAVVDQQSLWLPATVQAVPRAQKMDVTLRYRKPLVIDRRGFLAGAAAAAAALWPRFGRADDSTVDRNLCVLLADVHVGEDRDRPQHGWQPTKTAKSLEAAVGAILALAPRPAAVIVAGDCAFLYGESGDYAVLRKLLDPLRRAGVAVHLALGNHDNRRRFLAAMPEAKALAAADPAKLGKYVSVVETPHANWFLLDSLSEQDGVRGRIGEAQLKWLAPALDARPDKPALVVAHHNPDPRDRDNGLKDTAALFKVLESHRQVKAYVYGHTHSWKVARRSDVHLVNVPGTVWVFDQSQPRGFVAVRLRSAGATFELHALDPGHAKNGEKISLDWRV
jgi:3',5'-cyclic-AMP phosphodiesterase